MTLSGTMIFLSLGLQKNRKLLTKEVPPEAAVLYKGDGLAKENNKKPADSYESAGSLAERKGFEPLSAFDTLHDFQERRCRFCCYFAIYLIITPH